MIIFDNNYVGQQYFAFLLVFANNIFLSASIQICIGPVYTENIGSSGDSGQTVLIQKLSWKTF